MNVDEPVAEILERLGEGVILLDHDLRPVLVNQAARKMLGIERDTLPPRLPSEEILEIARRSAANNRIVDEVVTTWFPLRQILRVRAGKLDAGDEMLLLLDDVTEESLAQRVRREFVAHASHELKSPVAGLQALAEALTHALDEDPSTAARFSERISAESDRLGRLIGDLLDLSRLEDLATAPDAPVDLADLVRRELEIIAALSAEKDVKLEEHIEDDVRIAGDDQQLSALVRNLLDNAVRYTPAGGLVTVSLRGDHGDAVLVVADTGIGIPMDSQARIFERFYRIDRARSRDRGGTGLGLAIVKHVAELHGGNVTVESTLGDGSTFIARLPRLDERDVTTAAG